MFAKMREMDAKGASELFGSLSNKVVEVMASTPQQLAIDSAEKAGLTQVGEAKGASELFGSLSSKVVEVMASTPQQLAIDSAEKAGLTKVSEAFKSMENKIEKSDPLGIMDSGAVAAPESAEGQDHAAASWSTTWPTTSWAAFGATADAELDIAAGDAGTLNAERMAELEATILQLQKQLQVKCCSHILP